jgi:hypothetical protein
MFEDPGASMVAAVRVTCHPEAHVVLETGVDECFVYAKELTNLLDFVPISEEEKGYSGLEIIGFWWSHVREGRQQRVMESGNWSGSTVACTGATMKLNIADTFFHTTCPWSHTGCFWQIKRKMNSALY